MPKATKRERQHRNRELRRQAILAAQRRRRRIRTVRTLAIPLVLVIGIGVAISVLSGDEKAAAIRHHYSSEPKMTIDTTKSYTAAILTSEGVISVELDAVNSPKAVNNFVFLANHRFYDKLKIHRVANDPPIIQGGDPKGDGSGGPGYSVAAEAPTPAEGQPAYSPGALAMAKTSTDAAGVSGSQWFIVTGDTGLPPDYAYVGKVSAGLDIAQQIQKLVPASGDGPPTKQVTILSIRVTKAEPPTTTSRP